MSGRAVTVTSLRQMKRSGRRIAALTAYDASFAALLEGCGVDLLLVGDSLGMVVQGHTSTIPVTVEDMVYHTRAVARGRRLALVVADLPFLSYADPEQALHTAARLVKEGGADVVKLEGGSAQVDTVRRLAAQGIPVCGHLGLQPQSVKKLGGYRIQGREPEVAQAMGEDALALEAAGADLIVLECVPAAVAATITASVGIPVIGIGAGPDCDGQVLVSYDMLGLTSEPRPRFVQDFMKEAQDVHGAVSAYVAAVREGRFPTLAHSF